MPIKTAIIGVGRTAFGEHYEENPEELIEKAGLKALQSANIERKELDAIMISDYFLQVTNKIGLEEGFISELLDLNIPMETLRSFSSALNTAANAIEAGRYKIVMVGGVEKMTDRLDKIKDNLMTLIDSWSYYSGGTTEAIHEIMLREYIKKHRLNKEKKEKLMESLAYISHKNHEYGAKNPNAHFYRRRAEMERVIKARRNSLLGLYDFAPYSDGATAIVITNMRTAKKIAEKGLTLEGRGSATGHISYFTRKEKAKFKSTEEAARRAFQEAKINKAKITLAELYDQSTLMELIALENLGFCREGRAWSMIQESIKENKYTYNINGKEIYTNTNGGLKADGNPLGATGGAQIHEVYHQLLEEAGTRQIPIEDEDPYALTIEHEGFGTKTYVQILRRWIR